MLRIEYGRAVALLMEPPVQRSQRALPHHWLHHGGWCAHKSCPNESIQALDVDDIHRFFWDSSIQTGRLFVLGYYMLLSIFRQ